MSTITRLLVLCVFSLSFCLNTSAQISTNEQAASIKKLEAISQTLKQMQQHIPHHYLSPEALAEANDYEPEKIVAWIKQNIQFTPSPGYQLSPKSTLQTITGNALEQAVLLQNVLVQAGLEVRLASTTLDADQAMTLLRESFVPSPASKWELDPGIRNDYFKKLSLHFGDSENSLSERYASLETLIPWPQSPVYKQAKALAKEFSVAISKSQLARPMGSDKLLQPWIKNAQDYYFVKYRFSQGDPWAEAHPAFSASKPIIASSAYHTEGMEQQHHQITIQAFITREINGKKETVAVTGQHKSTVADLFEHQLRFATVPSGMHKALEQKSLKSLESGQFFAPSINNELDKGVRLFTADGRDYSPIEVSDPLGGIAISSNKKITQLTEKLGDKLGGKNNQASQDTSSSRLLHYFLAVTWSAPNGHKRSLRRTIYRHQTEQTPTQMLNAITQSAVLGVTPAILAPAAELHASLGTMAICFFIYGKAEIRPAHRRSDNDASQ